MTEIADLPPILRQIAVSESGCWEWTGTRTERGYGHVLWKGKTRRVHRVVYVLAFGPVPRGLEVDHTCRNRACCNPQHLEAVTHAENMRRADVWGDYWNKTHCRHGHELAIAGLRTWVNSRGYRVNECRQCRRDISRRYKARLKEAAA